MIAQGKTRSNLDLFCFIMTTQGVVNLSNRPLTQYEITLLQRGLKFCPTPACPDPGDGRADLDALHRRLRLMSFYEERPPTLNETSVSQDVGPSTGLPDVDQQFSHFSCVFKTNTVSQVNFIFDNELLNFHLNAA